MRTPRAIQQIIVGIAALIVTGDAANAQTVSLGPTPYLSATDSPFDLGDLGNTFFLEDFEDLALNTPGVQASGVSVIGPGSIVDSVDGDDGLIDGCGAGGHSLFRNPGSTPIVFSFDPAVLGELPTAAGIVWTDGSGTVFFEAFDSDGALITSKSGLHADGTSSCTTAEDRFYGVQHAGGISAIRIWNTSGGIEVDHLQYGQQNQTPLCDAGGPFDVQCAQGEVLIPLDGSGSSDPEDDPLSFLWSSDCPGASFDDSTSETPTLTIQSSGACSVDCTVSLTVDDGELSSDCTAAVSITPDTTLAGLTHSNGPVRTIIAPSASGQAVVEFTNGGSCPTEVTAINVEGDFSNPALALGSSAPALPLVVCPGDTLSVPVDITTNNALADSYQALVKISGATGQVSAGLEICVSSELKPDISIATPSITGDVDPMPPLVDAGQGFTISADISNLGNSGAGAFTLEFLAVVGDNEQVLGSTSVSSLATNASTSVQLHVAGGTLPEGFHVIRVQLSDPPPEGDLLTRNNSAATFLQLGSLPIEGAVIVVQASAAQGCVGDVINVAGRADYFLVSTDSGNEVVLLDFPVQGGKVTVTLLDSSNNVVSVTSTVHTLTTGTYVQPITTPPAGDYTIRVEVTDFSVEGVVEIPLTVLSDFACAEPEPAPPPPVPPPSLSLDLWVCSDNIEFFQADCTTPLAGNPPAGQPICIAADVSYFANLGSEPAPELLTQVVSAIAHVHDGTSSNFNSTFIGQRAVSFTGTGSLPVQFSWTPPSDGEHAIEIRWEPSISQYTPNDAATHGIVVGSGTPQTAVDVAVGASSNCGGSISISGRADYVSTSGQRVPVKCGLVTARVFDDLGVEIPSSGGVTHTTRNGNYTTTLFASTPAPGPYTVVVDVTDGTLGGSGQDVYSCVVPGDPDPIAPPPPPPSADPQFFGDVYIFAEDVLFLGDPSCSTGLLRNPEPGENIAINATVHFTQSGPQEAHTVTVTATEHIPIGDQLVPFTIGTAGPLNLPSAGGSVNTCIPWTPGSAGTRIVQLELAPDFTQYELNDAATRAFTVGTADCELDLSAARVDLIAGESANLVLAGNHEGEVTPTFELSVQPVPPATSLPAGLNIAFNPTSPLTSPFGTTMTINTDPTTPPGRYPLFVVGLGGVCNAVTTLTVNVASPNAPPDCVIATADVIPCTGQTSGVTLDGSGSTDPDGDDLTYVWETDCIGGVFDNATAVSPLLTIDTSTLCGLETAELSCNATLTVFDGLEASSCTQALTFADHTAPTIDVAAASVTLDCGSADIETELSAWLADLGGAQASDACGNVAWSDNFNGLSDGCGPTGSATVTFTAIDTCGNSASTQAMFTVVDETPPTITTAAQNLTVECDGAGNTNDLQQWLASRGGALASDSCGEISWSHDFNGLSDDCGKTGSATVTFTAADACGNASTTTASFTIVDTNPPLIEQAASGQLVECDGLGNVDQLNAWLDSNGGAVASDSCGGVTWTDDFTALTPTCGNAGFATVTFTAMDACGNESSTLATFDIVDTIAPQTTLVGSSSLVLEHAIEQYVEEGATVSDTCDPDAEVIIGGDVVQDAVGTYVVTYTGQDACGNETQRTRTVTVEDTIPPIFTSTPDDLTVECEGADGVSILNPDVADFLAAPVASDACDPTVGIAHDAPDPLALGETPVTWTAADFSGNTTTTSALITVVDTTAPMIVPPAMDETVACDGAGNIDDLQMWLDNVGYAEAEDLCSGFSWSNNFISLSDDCGASGATTVTFTATDVFGNSASTTGTFTIVDEAPPTLSTLPGDQTVECDGLGNTGELNAWLESNAGGAASDQCSSVFWSNDFDGLSTSADGQGSASVTFTAADDCSNASSAQATFSIVDTTEPVIAVGNVLEIWPPNHKYHTFDLSNCVMSVEDVCSGTLTVADSGTITSISSDEPENATGNGDGNTTNDMVILSPTTFKVRSERQGGGNGRMYRVNFAVADLAGNVSQETCFIAVTHDQSGDPAIDDGPSAGYTVTP